MTPTETKPGHKSSEFYIVLGTLAVNVLPEILHILPDTSPATKYATAAIAGLYAIGRAITKAAAVWGTVQAYLPPEPVAVIPQVGE